MDEYSKVEEASSDDEKEVDVEVLSSTVEEASSSDEDEDSEVDDASDEDESLSSLPSF